MWERSALSVLHASVFTRGRHGWSFARSYSCVRFKQAGSPRSKYFLLGSLLHWPLQSGMTSRGISNPLFTARKCVRRFWNIVYLHISSLDFIRQSARLATCWSRYFVYSVLISMIQPWGFQICTVCLHPTSAINGLLQFVFLVLLTARPWVGTESCICEPVVCWIYFRLGCSNSNDLHGITHMITDLCIPGDTA